MTERVSKFFKRGTGINYYQVAAMGEIPGGEIRIPKDILLSHDSSPDPENQRLLADAITAFSKQPDLPSILDKLNFAATAIRTKEGGRWVKFGLIAGAGLLGMAAAAAVVIHTRHSERKSREALIRDYTGAV